MTRAQTVAVAVSGGADSLYSLMRLQEAGCRLFALHGIFLEPSEPEAETRAVAMRERLATACRSLGIALHVRDLSAAFSRLVVRPFVQSYADGHTPNPCALCNARIKFGLLREDARSLGADLLATGHYARLDHGPADAAVGAGPESVFPALYQGADRDKDQSYFLALTPAAALASAVFPLQSTRKTEVLAALARRGIVPPQPGESQEVCFVPGDEYREFVPRMAERWGIALGGPGPALLRDGRRVGGHNGLWRYTEGQRRGLGIGWKEPLHVLGKEKEGNILRLGVRAEMAVAGCLCEEVNVLLPVEFWPETVLVKTRYRERPRRATAALLPGRAGEPVLRIAFADPETTVAPGQVAAVYVPGTGHDAENAPLRLAAGGVITAAFF